MHNVEEGLGYSAAMEQKPCLSDVKPITQRVNIVGLWLMVVIPWLLFCLIDSALAFRLRYEYPAVAYLVVALCVAAVAFMGVAAAKVRYMQTVHGVAGRTWHFPLFLTSGLAVVLACYEGDANYCAWLRPHYQTADLNTYDHVDVNVSRGDALLDAGLIEFGGGVILDVAIVADFKQGATYCVVPFTKVAFEGAPLDIYDLWAVGKDCCAESSFTCGGYSGGYVAGGVRFDGSDTDRALYRMAVWQAVSHHGVNATHPLLFHWSNDPAADLRALYRSGHRRFLLVAFAYFVFQLALVYLASSLKDML